jgi:hypothetical protein
MADAAEVKSVKNNWKRHKNSNPYTIYLTYPFEPKAWRGAAAGTS